MKHSDYLKKKKTRETRKRIISVISAIIVFVTAYTMVLPAITLDVSTARQEPGFAFEQVQFKTTAAAASVTAADSTVEEVPMETSASEEPSAEEPAEEETIEEEPAESSEEENSAVSDEQDETPAEPEQAEESDEPAQEEAPAAETEEVQEDKSEDSSSGNGSETEAESSEEQAADTQKAAEDTNIDQSGTDTAGTAETTAETAVDFQIPQLDALDFDDILTGKTAFYYYHPENAEEAENLSSDSIDDWKKADSDTVLAPEDFVRVYLSYEIPAGALNETNAAARYRLPAGLELSDKQIKAVNEYENGIAAPMSGSDHDKYLGAEAIEGSRTPDEKAGDEYISATVKAEKVYNDGDYAGQDLIFTFSPYTIEKNRISYDAKGEVIAEGEEVKGFFTFDLTTAQIAFEKTGIETVENGEGTKEELQYSKADIDFAKDIDRTLTLAVRVENDETRSAADQDDAESTAAEDKSTEDKAAEKKAVESKTAETEVPKTKLRSKAGGALKAGDGAERTVVATGSAGKGVTWTLYDDGEVVFTSDGTGTVVSMTGGGSLAEYKDQVKKMTFEDGITSISGRYAFQNCDNLETVIFPASLVSIDGGEVFQSCDKLRAVDFSGCPELEGICGSCFSNCPLLADVNFTGCDKLRTIGDNAFENCTELESIDLSNKTALTSLGSAFRGCTGLKSVNLSGCSSLTELNRTCSGCSSLETVTIDGVPLTSITNWAFYGCSKLTEFDFEEVWNTLETIGNGAFQNSGLTNLNLSGNTTLKTIGQDAFSGTKIEDLDLSGCSSLETVGQSAFSSIETLKTIDLSECTALKSIGANAFSGWSSSLETIDFTNCSSLETIGNRAFNGKHSNKIQSITFDGCTSLTTIGTAAFAVVAYQHDMPMVDFTPLTALETIGDSAFEGNQATGTVMIPPTVKTIGSLAFAGGSGLYQRSDTKIDAVDFSQASSLESIGTGAFQKTSIRSADFSGCTELKSIGTSAFEGCSKLAEIDLSEADKLETIGYHAFSGCISAISIEIPESVISIDETAFTNNSSVNTLVWDAKNYTEPLSNLTFNESNGFSSGYDLIIGKDVNVLPDGFFRAVSCGDVYFRGENSRIDISAAASEGAPIPIRNIDGPCYVDAYGVVYEIEGEGDQQYARVAYCPPGIENYTVPTEIPFEGKQVPVKEIANSAFVLAHDLEEIRFEDAAAITSVGNNAFYGIGSLTKVTDQKTSSTETTISGAISLFTGTTAPRSAFLRTGLTDDVTDQVWDNGSPAQKLSKENNGIRVSIDKPSRGTGETGYVWNEEEGKYEYYTGAYLNTIISAANDGTGPATARIYMDYSNDSYVGLRDSFTIEGSNIDVEIKDTSNPDIKYMEFTLPVGSTLSFTLNTTYPSPQSAGGDLHMWIDLPADSSVSPDPVPLTQNEEYLAATWATKRQERKAEKNPYSKNHTLQGDGIGEKALEPSHSWWISLPNEGDPAYEAVGKDYCESVEYTDTLTLPEGWKWNDNLFTALEANRFSSRRVNNTTYFYIVNEDNTTSDVCALAIPAGTTVVDELTLTPMSAGSDGQKNVVFHWKLKSKSGEFPKDRSQFTIYQPFLEVNLTNYPDGGYTLTNTVNMVLDYAHSGDKELSASASIQAKAADANLTLAKRRASGIWGRTINMGQKETFYLDVKNTGTLSTDNILTVSDPLDEYMYIQAPDMERMFDAVYGDKLEITIAGAQFFDEPEQKTATGIDGSTVDLTAANSAHYPARSTQNEIKIRKAQDDGYILSIGGEDRPCASIQEALDSLGYVVTNGTTYSVVWTFNTAETPEEERFIVYGNMLFSLPIYVTQKNTFEMLPSDWMSYYRFPDDWTETMTNVGTLSKLDGTNQNASVKTYNLVKDVTFTKSATRNGNSIPLFHNERFNSGDLLEYTLKIVNNGTTLYDLPLIDEIRGAQLLLVPVRGNSRVDWGTAGIPDVYTASDGTEYYRLDREGEYSSVLTSSGFIADTIKVTPNDSGWKTEIKWYYPSLGVTTSNVTYKTLVETDKTQFPIQNEAWLNDRTGDRLTTILGGSGSSISFDKQIVTRNPNIDGTTEGEECDPRYYKALTKDDHEVVYKLTISAEGTGVGTVTGADFFDRLPQTYGVFDWTKADNVSISWRTNRDNLVKLSGIEDWYLTKDSPDTAIWADNVEGQYYLRWPDSTKIEFKGRNGNEPPELYLYVTLHFTDEWSRFCSEASGDTLMNSLYVNGFPKTVTHDVQAEGRVVMQKGVYSISHISETDSRYYFQKKNSHVEYYILLYNGGDTRFYLNDIVDTLPDGFAVRDFGSLGNNGTSISRPPYSTWAGDWNKRVSMTLPPEKGNPTIKHALVKGIRSDNEFRIQFVDTNGKAIPEDGCEYVGFDKALGKAYLEPNDAVMINYICLIDPDKANDEMVNTNRIVMDYYDPNSVGVSVYEDAEITSAPITVGGSTINPEPNDGDCRVVNAPDGGKQLVSEVSIGSGEILPGESKSVVSYEAQGRKQPVVFGQEAIVPPYADLIWEVRNYNEGTKDINGYTIKDTIQAPYRFGGDVNYVIYQGENSTQVASRPYEETGHYTKPLFTIVGTNETAGTVTVKDIAGTNHTVQIGGDAAELELPYIALKYNGKDRTSAVPYPGIYYQLGGSGTIKVSFAIDPVTKAETMSIEFTEDTMPIFPGCVGKLSVRTDKTGTVEANTIYVNIADLIPSDKNYDSSMVNHGNPVYDNDGRNDYIESYGFVTTASGYATASRKHVTEKDSDPLNTAHSYEPVNYITLSEKDNEFTYTLEVDNTNEDVAIDKITFVDNLPYIGDGYTLRNEIKRNSRYKVNFADDPNVTVSVIYPDKPERKLDPGEYTVKYSDKQVLDLERGHANDWNLNAETWGNKTDTSRSLLVTITDNSEGDSEKLMTGGSRIRVSFDAVASDDAAPGLIAYNSFAYNYEVNHVALESSPLIVGTRVKDYPYLQKVLVDKNGNSYKTDKDLTFKFLVFKGDKSLISDAGDADLQTYLADHDIPNHVFDVAVSNGKSSSEQVRLAATEDFEWEDQKTYTVVELTPRAYNFNRWKNGGSGAYTFTYNASRTQVFTAENVNIEWDVHLLKLDAEDDETHLKGAVFARYSPNRLDAITDEAYNAIETNYGLKPVRSYEEKDSDGKLVNTWYLADTKETGLDGTIDWEDLVEDEYDLVEIKAPDGYMIEDKTYRVTRHDNVDDQGRVLITMKNQKGYELPSTGGIGRLPFMFTGLLLIMASALMYGFRMRQRERRVY